jgi:hypothetical protein
MGHGPKAYIAQNGCRFGLIPRGGNRGVDSAPTPSAPLD